jgi:hypothetical protein
MGLDLPRLTWSEESQIFSSQDIHLATFLHGRPKKQEVRKWDQLPRSFLSRNAVDVLILDTSPQEATRAGILPMLEATPAAQRPKAIIIAGPSQWVLNLPIHSWRRERRKSLEKLGYLGLEWFMSAEQQGSALQQERLVEVFLAVGEGRAMPEPPPPQGLPARPMRNLLLPINKIPRQSRAPQKTVYWPANSSMPIESPQVVGRVGDQPLYSSEGVMPDHLGAWIADSDTGVHRLQTDELAKGKGLPSEWRTKDTILPDKAIQSATCVHIWTAVCDTLGRWLKRPQGDSYICHPDLRRGPHTAPDGQGLRPAEPQRYSGGKLGILAPRPHRGRTMAPSPHPPAQASHPGEARRGPTLEGGIGRPEDPQRKLLGGRAEISTGPLVGVP